MQSSLKLGRVAGIEVGIHYTWLFAFALITWSLASGYFPFAFPGFDASTYWLMGAVAALALFVSVLIHELSHSFVAIARGQEVTGITLFIFGGVSNIKDEAEEPRDEFLVAVVGPLTSFALAAIFWVVGQALQPGNTPLGAVLSYLILINVVLGVFNLVPGFPLDGGRVLRAIIWKATGSLRRATQIASYVGQGVGFLLIMWGLYQFFTGQTFGGLWIAFIGWFLNSAAESARQQQVVQENLRGVPVAALMKPEAPSAHPDESVHDFVFEHVLRRGNRAVLVADAGRVLGIASISDVKDVPEAEWGSTPISQIMTAAPLKTVASRTDLTESIKLLADGTLNQLPVMDQGRVVGWLSRADILRFLQLRDQFDLSFEEEVSEADAWRDRRAA